MSDRSFEIALFGATGFTGRLVAEYLARSAPRDLRWCIVGRNRDKLERVRRDLAAIEPSCEALPIQVADTHDAAALDPIVSDSRVVCTTVGPFAIHGVELARAAAKRGTHYCDSTGETTFVRRSIDENHGVAASTGARLVHCCGFDSVPFDLGVHMLWARAKHKTGNGLRWAKGFAGETSGGFSSGTLSTMINVFEQTSRDRATRRLLRDPHALDPDPGSAGGDPFEVDQKGIRWDSDVQMWTVPFIMAVINTRIVRRSNALVDGGYGKRFLYNESMSMKRGPTGFLAACAVTAGIGALAGALAYPRTREAIARRIPAGAGPSKEKRERGFFTVRFVAEAEDGETLRGRVEGTSDPGYGETSKMLAESALCLARDASALPDRAGVLTPASAMGMHLVDRLRRAGMTFLVEPSR